MINDSLEKWVNQFADELLSWAIFKVSDTQLAQDLVQDTFLVASEKYTSFKGNSSPKTWLFSILNFKIIDHYRAKARKPMSIESQSLSTYFSADGEWIDSKRPTSWNEDEGHLLDDDEFNLVLKSCN